MGWGSGRFSSTHYFFVHQVTIYMLTPFFLPPIANIPVFQWKAKHRLSNIPSSPSMSRQQSSRLSSNLDGICESVETTEQDLPSSDVGNPLMQSAVGEQFSPQNASSKQAV